ATVPFSAWIDLLGWRVAFFTADCLLCCCGLLLYFVLIKKPQRISFNEPEVVIDHGQRERTVAILRRIFSNRQAWALFCCHFGVVGGYVGFISSWAVPYGMNMYEMTRSEASQLIMIGLIGALIGAPLLGWISSWLGMIKKPYIIVQITVLIGWFTFLLCKGKPTLYLLILLFFIIGIGYGASALTFAAVRKSFPLKDSGIVSGFANTGGFLSAVLLPIIFGLILDYFQSTSGNLLDGYYYSFITPVLFSLIGLLGIMIYKEKHQELAK
ncbi:MAG: MFS transporter, partial [Solibacillus sp.]